jgi:long-subunit acyl-CoA synthetase (AMP-forming)
MSKNRWEMSAMDIASICQGFTQVPLYDTLGKEAVEWILSQTELDVV